MFFREYFNPCHHVFVAYDNLSTTYDIFSDVYFCNYCRCKILYIVAFWPTTPCSDMSVSKSLSHFNTWNKRCNPVMIVGCHTIIYLTISSIWIHDKFLVSHGLSEHTCLRSTFSLHEGHVSFFPTINQPLIHSG